ncbi:MAG: orotidine 5'-phosphate decarboxylase / HUMPS family protein [Alloacidobacterium sp.]|jgi:3-keto-L-gulonate-6-phosphate decarboxylase
MLVIRHQAEPVSIKLSMKTIVQISLDLITISEALETARLALNSGVDWLEAGTPLIIAEGINGVRALRAEFPDVPIVADLKIMDGGWLEAQMMAKAGATHVVVMERAHPGTTMMDRQPKKRSGQQTVPTEPEILKVIGEQSRRNGTDKLTSRQIDETVKAYRKTKKKARALQIH